MTDPGTRAARRRRRTDVDPSDHVASLHDRGSWVLTWLLWRPLGHPTAGMPSFGAGYRAGIVVITTSTAR